jgi:hypothetical protein
MTRQKIRLLFVSPETTIKLRRLLSLFRPPGHLFQTDTFEPNLDAAHKLTTVRAEERRHQKFYLRCDHNRSFYLV